MFSMFMSGAGHAAAGHARIWNASIFGRRLVRSGGYQGDVGGANRVSRSLFRRRRSATTDGVSQFLLGPDRLYQRKHVNAGADRGGVGRRLRTSFNPYRTFVTRRRRVSLGRRQIGLARVTSIVDLLAATRV